MKDLAIDAQQTAHEYEVRLRTRYFRSERQSVAPEQVSRTDGRISGISVVTAGEAKGHEVWLDDTFVADVVRLGNNNPQGIKARFGHPTMSAEALGTYLGQFTNFRLSKDGRQALADLQLNEAAKVSPNGDLYEWILTMAKTAPEQLGASIVFGIGIEYYHDLDGNHTLTAAKDNTEVDDKGNAKRFVSISALYGADMVDEPAANEAGLFSAVMNPKAFAVQLTTFLDANAALTDWLLKNPENAIDKLRQFLRRYAEYRAKTTYPMPYFSIDKELPDGKSIRVFTDSDTPTVGDSVVLLHNGIEVPTIDGEYTTTEGSKFSVKDKCLTAIVEASAHSDIASDDDDIALLKSDNERLKSELSKIRSLYTALAKRVSSLEAYPAAKGSLRSPAKDGYIDEYKSMLDNAPHNIAADNR